MKQNPTEMAKELLEKLQQALAANAALMEEVKAMRKADQDGYETGEEKDKKYENTKGGKGGKGSFGPY